MTGNPQMELFPFMTLSASLLILAALILRPLTGRLFPRSSQMFLWIAASLRLLIPIRITAPFSLFSLMPRNIERSGDAFEVLLPKSSFVTDGHFPGTSPVLAESSAQTASYGTFTELLPFIWITGTVLTAAVLLFLHGREMHRCRCRTRDRDAERLVPGYVRVYRCKSVCAPFVSGLFLPRIFLPAALPEDDLPAVLAHETAHIRGLDILKKHLFFAALCVNWFNPLVWIMVRLSAQDIELLCDRRTLCAQNAPNPKVYAHALLNAEERRTLFALSFKSNTEMRIIQIFKKEKINRVIALLSVLLVVLLTAAFTVYPAQSYITTEETRELFVHNHRFALGDFHTRMSVEEAYAVIRTMGITKEPALQAIQNRPGKVYTTIPYTFGDYKSTVRLYFDNSTLTEIFVDLDFRSADAASKPYNSILTQLSSAFGTRGSYKNIYTGGYISIWDKADSLLSLSAIPHGISENAGYTVRIQIQRISQTTIS